MKSFLPISKRVINNKKGFTFIEVVISATIFFSLLGVITINLLDIHRDRSIQAIVTILVTDLKAQQIKSMSGNTQNTPNATEYGIYFESDKYTLFQGDSYTPGSESNFEVPLADGFMLTDINLQNSQIIFEQGSGEIKDYIEGQNSVTVLDTQDSESTTIVINKYGLAVTN